MSLGHAWRALAVLGLIGCAADPVRTVDVSEAKEAVGFVVRVDVDGTWAAIGAPFGLDADGALGFGARPQLTLPADTEGLVVLVPVARVLEAVPGFDDAMASDLRLFVDDVRPLELLPDGRLRTSLGLPEGTRVWRVRASSAEAEAITPADPLGADAQARLTLGVPFDPEHCRPQAQANMQPWGPDDPLEGLRDLDLWRRFDDVVHFDADHLLVAAPASLLWLERGVGLDASDLGGPPYRILPAQEVLPGGAGLEDLAWSDLAADPRDRRTLFAVASHTPPDAPSTGYVVRLRAGPEGITEVRTATVVRGFLEQIAIAEDGAWLAAGVAGINVRGHVDHDEIVLGPRPTDVGNEIRAVAATGRAEAPWMMSGTNRVHTFSPSLDAWTTDFVGIELGETIRLRGLAVARRGEVVEHWTGGTNGSLFLGGPGLTWQLYEPQMPPRFGVCTQRPNEPRPRLRVGLDDIAAVGEQLYIVADDCAALMQMRLQDRCTSLLGFGDGPDAGDGLARAIDVFEEQVVVVGEDAKVWVAPTR